MMRVRAATVTDLELRHLAAMTAIAEKAHSAGRRGVPGSAAG
jgi:hypothetical protein